MMWTSRSVETHRAEQIPLSGMSQDIANTHGLLPVTIAG
ncbi:hypothetical protein Pd630_LPD08051 [Rhodococcus opacus PD630]|nr:hypothetical protein Pd630_LPD08051 [Rhodococcus opacus PD630]